jgi:adenine/guanine/hypoxanthine permease
VRLSLLGLALNAVLLVRRVPSAILIGVLATALLGADAPLVAFQSVLGAPPAPSAAFQLDFAGLFERPWESVLSALFVLCCSTSSTRSAR